MSANIANALKVLIENASLGVAGYRDTRPADTDLPCVTLDEAIATTPDSAGDGGQDSTCTETVQVNTWEQWKDEDGNLVESDLALNVVRVLQGARLETAPMRVHGVRVISRRRLIEADRGIIHNAITANVRRVL